MSGTTIQEKKMVHIMLVGIIRLKKNRRNSSVSPGITHIDSRYHTVTISEEPSP